MITVWVLFFYMGTNMGFPGATGGPMIIDNIASAADCQNVAKSISKNFELVERYRSHSEFLCIEVRKVKP